MLTTISEHPGLALAFMVFLSAILSYFIKRVLSKVEFQADVVNELKISIERQLANMRLNIKEDMTSIFNSTCEERQTACSKFQQAKLDAIVVSQTALCSKLGRLDVERKEAWSEQRRWNDKIELTIYKRPNGKPS